MGTVPPCQLQKASAWYWNCWPAVITLSTSDTWLWNGPSLGKGPGWGRRDLCNRCSLLFYAQYHCIDTKVWLHSLTRLLTLWVRNTCTNESFNNCTGAIGTLCYMGKLHNFPLLLARPTHTDLSALFVLGAFPLQSTMQHIKSCHCLSRLISTQRQFNYKDTNASKGKGISLTILK